MTETVPRATVRESLATWRGSRHARIVGSFASWFLFSLAFTLSYLIVTSIMAVGSPCAPVGPDDITTPCSDAVGRLTPFAVIIGIAAVAIAVWLAQGFGTPLVVWAWPIFFCGIGSLFILTVLATGEVFAFIIGLTLLIMGTVPLFMELRAGSQRAFLGAVNSQGEHFVERAQDRPSLLSNKSRARVRFVEPKPVDWVASFGILAISTGAGYVLARVLFFG